MGRKRTRAVKPRASDFIGGRPQWRQSEALNQLLYRNIEADMINICLSRFKWHNLPKSCDARFLEYTLLFDGCATIACPRKISALFSTQMVQQGPLNIYYNPRAWQSYGINGWNFSVNHKNGVVIYDNQNRTPTIDIIRYYASELTDIYMTKRMNRFHQKLPYILNVPQEQELDAQNLISQISSGELAILTTNGLENIGAKTEVLQTNVQYLGDKLQEDIQATWNQFYQQIGVNNLPFKAERQTADEIQDYSEPTELRKLAYLEPRRAACDMLNRRFSNLLPYGAVSVTWNHDNFTTNYDYTHSLPDIMEAEK